MIRRATYEDIPEMLSLGRMFYETVRMESIPYNPVSTEFLFREMISNATAAVFVLCSASGEILGAIGGTQTPATYNFDHTVVLENFWFVNPEKRGTREALRLPETLEQWAREQGARMLVMGAFAFHKAAALDRFYTMRGYVPSETLYFKEL